MAGIDTSQGLGLYVNGSRGRCSVIVNDYLLYEQLRKGHSFSSKINFWVNPGLIDIGIDLSPAEKVFHLDPPQVELFLQSSGSDRGLIVQMPEPTPAKRSELVKRSDGSIEKIELRYQILIEQPPFHDWVSVPQPWIESSNTASLAGIYDLYQKIETAFLAKDKPAILELARQKLAFSARRMQISEEDMRVMFSKQIAAVLQSSSVIEHCLEPKVQLKLFPVKKGLVYKIEWASGMSAIHTQADSSGFQQGFQVYVALVRGNWVWII